MLGLEMDDKEEQDELIKPDKDLPAEENPKIHELNIPKVEKVIILRDILKTTAPLFIVSSFNALDEFIKFYILSKISENTLDTLSASALVSTFSSIALSFNGLLNPITSMISKEYALANKEKIGSIIQQGWFLSVMIAVPTTISFWFAEPILKLLSQPEELAALVGSYTRPYCIAVLPSMAVLVDTAFLKSIDKEITLIPWSFLNAASSTALSYILATGQFGLPKLGIVGISYGNIFQAWLGWLSLLGFYLINKDFQPYQIFKFRLSNTFNELKMLFKLGLPSFLLSLLEETATFFLGIMTGRLGSHQLTIGKISTQYLRFFKPPTDGIRQASQIYVSRYFGKSDYEKIRHYGNIGIYLETGLNIIPVALFTVFPLQLTRLFLDEQSQTSENFIRLVFLTRAITKLFDGIQLILSDNLRGIFDTWSPALINLLSSGLFILPFAYLFAFSLEWDLIGINTAIDIGLAFSLSLLSYRWHTLSHNQETIDAKLLKKCSQKLNLSFFKRDPQNKSENSFELSELKNSTIVSESNVDIEELDPESINENYTSTI
jgi:MATE family multidrug resistance protein